MSEWKKVKIGELASQITSGGTPSTKHSEYYNGIIPWLNTKEIKNCRIYKTEKHITDLGLKNSSAKWINKNSVIVAMYGATAGKVAINKIPLSTNQACCNITLDKEKANYNFIYYLLLNSFAELSNLTSGAAQQNLNVGLISNLDILLPPLPEQKAIAAVLSRLDDKIDLLHRQNKTLEAMAETLFRQWFSPPPPKGGEDNEDVKSPLGDLGTKEEWECKKLGDILTVIESGSRPKGGINPDLKTGIPSLGAESINGLGNYNYTNTKYITSDFFEKMKRGKVRDYDVLIYKDGAYIGKKSMFANGFPFQQFAINEHVFILRAGSIFSQLFLYFSFEQEELALLNANSAQPGLNQTSMKSFEILVPDRDFIELFGKEVKPLIDKIFFNGIQIRTIEKLRDTLLPKLMSGEVRIHYTKKVLGDLL